MNIYVGNISREATEEEIQKMFEPHGEVASVKIIKDKFSGESRGFAFVEMPQKAQADAAIQELAGKDLGGRALTVNEARPKTTGGGFGGGGGGNRGGFGGGNRGGNDRGRRGGNDRGGSNRNSW